MTATPKTSMLTWTNTAAWVMVFTHLMLAPVASAQISTVTLFASSVPDAANWTNESTTVGDPGCGACDCNVGGANQPYAIQGGVSVNDWLVANMQNWSQPAGTCIVGVYANVMSRFDSSDPDGGRVDLGVDIPGGLALTSNRSATFTSSDNCQYRFGSLGWNITGLRAWTQSDINNMRLHTRRVLEGTVTTYRVKTLRLIIQYAPIVQPPTIQVSGSPSCSGGAVSLSVNVPNGASVTWFANSCSGPVLGTSSSLVVSPSATTVYYAALSNDCGTVCGSTTVVVDPPACLSAPHVPASPIVVCPNQPGPIVLSATACRTTESLEWFLGANCSGQPVFTGPSLTIPIPPSTTTYSVRSSSHCGSSPCSAVTIEVRPGVPSAPSLSATPPIVCDNLSGGTITLCASDSVVWFGPGTCQPNEQIGSGQCLTVNRPTATATFHAIRSNPCGVSPCVALVVPVTTGPTAQVAPLLQSACVGTTAIISGSAGACSPTSVFWKYNDGTPILDGTTPAGSVISGSSSSVLTVSNVRPQDARGYQLCQMCECGVACSPTSVLLVPGTGPVFFTQPTPLLRTGRQCENKVLTVGASGAQPITYAWFKGGTPVVGLPNAADYSGAGSPSLTVRASSALVVGDYSCVATNACGTQVSASGSISYCDADFDCSGSVQVADIFSFISAWFAADPRADFNGIGGLGVQDLFDFLAEWFAGCPDY